MSLSRLLVTVDLGPTAADRIRLAAALAQECGAGLTGVAARPLPIALYSARHHPDPAMLLEEEERARAQIEEARDLFEREAQACRNRSWRSALASPLTFISTQARSADLVVTSRQGANDGDAGLFGCSTGDLLMSLGRAMLLVPPNLDRLRTDRIVVAWKDTREARRALGDALPLIGAATHVDVVGVAPDVARADLEDVAGFLQEHGASAAAHLLDADEGTVTDALLTFARDKKAGLLVAGAYGHSRLAEWMFGGVTRSLLAETPLCCLLSH